MIPALLICLYYKFLSKNKLAGKIIKYSLLTIAILAIIYFIFLLVLATNLSLETAFKENAFLNRVFLANRFVSEPFKLLKEIIAGNYLFGIYPTTFNYNIVDINTRMFEFEIVKEAGLIPLFLLIIFIIIVGFVIAKYLRTSKDNDYSKVIFVSLIVTFFFYMSFNYASFPYSRANTVIYGSLWDLSRYNSFFKNPLSLVMLFLLGYVYVPLFIKDDENYGREIVVKEEIKKMTLVMKMIIRFRR